MLLIVGQSPTEQYSGRLDACGAPTFPAPTLARFINDRKSAFKNLRSFFESLFESDVPKSVGYRKLFDKYLLFIFLNYVIFTD